MKNNITISIEKKKIKVTVNKNLKSKGIRQWLIDWCTMYIPNDDSQISPSVA